MGAVTIRSLRILALLFFTAAALFACSARQPANPAPRRTVESHVVTLTGMGGDRISSVTFASNGDAVVGVTRALGGGALLRVSQTLGLVETTDVSFPVARLATDRTGRICYAAYVGAHVFCRRGDRVTDYRLIDARKVTQLLRFGSALLAIDGSTGRTYDVETSGARRVYANLTARTGAADRGWLALLEDGRLCFIAAGGEARSACHRFSYDLGPTPTVAIANAVFVAAQGDRKALITVRTNGSATTHPSAVPIELLAGNGADAVWIVYDITTGMSLSRMTADGRTRRLRLPISLSAGSLLASNARDGLLIADDHQRVVVFLKS